MSQMWLQKNVLIGVCGGIAAYKIPYLVRLLVKEGASVKVILTPDAQAFVSPLTLSTLSKNTTLSALYDAETATWNNHVELAMWADIFVIAPATANTLAKMAHGICDNLLLATYLSAKCTIYFAPAMDLDMWKHPSTQQNIQLLQKQGNILIAPESGELASGLMGEGRMAEPETIVEQLQNHFNNGQKAAGLKVLVTAGPTYEAIDPVRFIGNHSSGKMGYAIAAHWAQLGAEVTLITGPTALEIPHQVKSIQVQSADEMLQACLQYFPQADITVMSAAVADYTPAEIATQKIKKNTDKFELELVKTVDILQKLGTQKQAHQCLIGFALETENEIAHAEDKLQRKNLDAIVLNSLQDDGAGFKKDTNKITIINRNLEQENYATKSKSEVAKDICNYILKLISR